MPLSKFKFTKPLRLQIEVIPQKGKDAKIDFKVFAAKGENPPIVVIFYIFHTLYKSLLKATHDNTNDDDLKKMTISTNLAIAEKEGKVKIFDKIKKIFIT